jgi:hypothetical protein
MRKTAEQANLSTFSVDLVEDLINIEAGGEFLLPSRYREDVRREASSRVTKDRYGEWYVNGYRYYSKGEAIQASFEEMMEYQQNVADFVRSVDLSRVPGFSPLERAMNLLRLLATQDGGEGGANGEPLPIFMEKTDVGDRLSEILDQVESLSDLEEVLIDSEEEEGSGSGSHGTLKALRLAEDMAKGRDVWLRVSRKLDGMVRMNVAKSVKLIPDPEGEEVQVRPIKHLGELDRISKTEWALPEAYRFFRAISHVSQVRERVRREEKQQLLYVLIDCSGSMGNGDRIAKAGGVLMNRLKAVVKGEAQIYVRFFDSRLYQEHHAKTPQEAQDLVRLFKQENFSGGSTNISGCVRDTLRRIQEIVAHGGVTRPELVVISDGDDQISLTAKEIAGTKMHAFLVGLTNRRLMELARQSGGVGIDRL